MKKPLILFTILFCSIATLYSQSNTENPLPNRHFISSLSPASPYPYEFIQPDGSILNLVTKGDGLLNRTFTEDGYTVLRIKNGIYYATLDANGNYIATQELAHNVDNRKNVEIDLLAKEARFPSFSDAQINNKRKTQDSVQNTELTLGRASGIYRTLFILIDFPDKPAIKTKDEFQNYAMQPNYNGTGSMRDYYLENSFGKLDLQIDVFGWYRAKYNWAYYGANNATTGQDVKTRDLVKEAIAAAEAAGVNFKNYDNNGDGRVDGVQIIHAGGGEEAASGSNPDAIWSQSSYLSPSVTYDGVKVSAHTINPELFGTGTNISTIGVVCHEFGHNLGLPDYYDRDYSSDGLGNWDLMAGGSWNNSGQTPACHNAWSKYVLGWHTPTVISTAKIDTLDYSYRKNQSYKITTSRSSEYFLLENRQKIGFDKYLPGKGMLIFHIDEDTLNYGSVNDNEAHYGIDIEEADGSAGTSTYSGDAFPGTLKKINFNDTTAPSSKSWANANINKPIKNIREVVKDSTIIFEFMGAGSKLPISDFYSNKTQIYPGQTINFSDNSYNTPDSWQWFFEGATPSSSTNQNPTGILYQNTGLYKVTLITTNSFGTDTLTISKMIYVINNYIMESQTYSACEGKFFDAGGATADYPNTPSVKIMIFKPSTTGSVLEFNFSEFNLESDSACINDYLEIYDGISTASTKIGRYCGTTGPGIVKASNNEGALTFKFKSNSSVTSSGWAANFSCSSPNGISDYNKKEPFEAYPNPASNNLNINFQSSKDRNVSFYSMDGREVFKTLSKESTLNIDIKQFESGIYILKVSDKDSQTTKKIIIEK